MSVCTYHPTEGYYSRKDKDPISKQGDFITSPEISQVFGELIAVWYLHQYHSIKHSLSHEGKEVPKKVRFVELGPGNGTLMSDILRTWKSFPSAWNSLDGVHLVETSPTLRETQKSTLESYDKDIQFYDRIQHIEKDDTSLTFIVAHEFFDALPIHVFQKTDVGFREVLVDLTNPRVRDSENESEAEKQPAEWNDAETGFKYVVSKQQTPMSSFLPLIAPHIFSEEGKEIGQRLELNVEGYYIANAIGSLLEGTPGGAALIVDYGQDGWTGDTLRGFRNHKQVDVLSAPGECDITSDVDFGVLRESLSHNSANVVGSNVMTQRDFLIKMGVAPRLDTLLANAMSKERKLLIAESAKRLLDVRGMGNQYKFMAGFSSNQENRYPFE
ncbi:DUF185-domain-containing protein [Wallemia mellicola CBS 633.66]|uniref:Protein arginine methyltransferase NDUFAF7 n=1 Tax=Wallemia mellicola (strain ATCC MYA-4683 / CBS 633.66) TaxID=671144 RepID=I4Y7I1_WALMC|nr:DUF185-domain-containing protein [Wallemia mellicola CBS 633.66]EIM19923.1 DUF185-domain-containing protein [Wallemia mellicola CBS 633.66]|eukprot:XP_006960062.1 DUF185-domain-containing protein [Wallemia mellicola CBS 633.66]